jgi:HK97 family phage major capsid protein
MKTIRTRKASTSARAQKLGADRTWPGGIGEFIQAVARAHNTRVFDPRLSINSALGSNESVPAEGGFLVPSQWVPILMALIENESSLAPYCTEVPISVGNRGVFPAVDEDSRANGSRWGGITSAWQQEAATLVPSKAAFRSSELILGKLTALVYATEELFEDSALLGAFVELAFPLEAAFRLDEAVLKGSGAGQPLGLLHSDALVTVSKDSGQAAGTITPSNITAMFGRMLPESRRRAVWLVGTTLEEALYTLNTGTAGQAALMFTAADEAAPYGRLMNRPILPVEQCAPIGTTGDIVFADLSRYLIATKPLNLDMSIHLQFVSGQVVFRLTYRADGQPALKTPITPYDGGAPRSSFVALQSR